MFSPAVRTRSARKAPLRQSAADANVIDSPTSGLLQSSVAAANLPQSLPKHPFRVAPILKSGEKTSAADGCDPVFVCDFPHQLRSLIAEAIPLHRSETRGGMEGEAGLSWVLYGNQLFIWSHLNNQSSSDCKILTVPAQLCTSDGQIDPKHGNAWFVRIITGQLSSGKETKHASLLLSSQKSLALVYWPDIFSAIPPVVSADRLKPSLSNQKPASSSLIVSGTKNFECIAIASCSNELWRFDCSPSGISQQCITNESTRIENSFGPFDFSNSGVRHSLVWLSQNNLNREFLVLTSRGIECYEVELTKSSKVSKVWAYDISEDAEVRADLTGQKQVWLLDLQVSKEKNLTVLAASLSKDRVTNSSYMQYFLLTFLYTAPSNAETKCLKKKAPAQVILPKARVEEEEFLYGMRLRVDGKPSGSVLVLASDGTATISHYLHGVSRLYQFDLAWDAGRVLDATVVPSVDGNEEGAWLVLTEKAGVWGIPEKAVVLSAVEPPERSLSRKGSANEDGKNLAESSLRLKSLDNSEKTLIKIPSQRPLQDEEAEALIGRLFQSYLTNRQAIGVLEKLQRAGAFEQDGEMNIFARFSKSIVDTIAKHWAPGGGAGAALNMAVASQLAEKQRRYQQYLNFLAASKCHELLKHQLRESLHTIMEHGEKLMGMLKLKDMYNSRAESVQGDECGALWETVHLVGEKARRKNVTLMDKEKVEVFFTRVSQLEDLFQCIEEHNETIVGKGSSQIERLCEVSEACTLCIRAALEHRDTQQAWYPPLEGLTPWYCKSIVRSGLGKLASQLMQIEVDLQLKEKPMEWLKEVADVLLESYAGAIAAKLEREEEFRGLQREYWTRRDNILSVIQQHDKEMAEYISQNVEGGEDDAEEKRLEVLRERYAFLLALARRHAGYQTLWEICIDLNDIECLRRLMQESMGLKEGRFSIFVFEQFLKTGQHAKLLRLGEEFKDDLATFLQGQKSLSWLHGLFLRRFNIASAAMHSLALSGNAITVPVIQDRKSTLAARRKLLYLAKLSALAGGERGVHDTSIRIDADLKLLAVQEAACELGVATTLEVMSPLQLVETCLSSNDRDLTLRSLEVFAVGGDVFRRGNRSLLEASWLRVADLDDWINMRQTSDEQGWSDEQQYEALKSTALFAASKYCYGGAGFIVGRPFEETLPAFRQDGNVSSERAHSVEEVLMQHRDFSEAGEAMVMALRMGMGLDISARDDMDI